MEVGSDDELVSAVAKSVRHEGLFEHYYDDLVGYLKHFAPYGWDAGADRQAEAYLQKYIEEMRLHYAGQAEREEWLELADSPSVTAWKQYAAKSGIERVLVLDAKTQAMLHDQPGVVGDDGHQTAGLQDYVVDVLRQFETIYIHNHPNGTGASAADLQSAFDAGADMLIVVTEGGYEEVYIRGSLEMKLVRRGPASYEVGPLTTGEFVEQVARSQRQARLEADDPAEYVFHEDEPPVEIRFEGSLKASTTHERVVLDQNETFQFNRQTKFEVLGRSHLNFYVVLVETEFGTQLWLDLRDNPEFVALEADIANLGIAEESNQPFPTPEEVKRSFETNLLGQVDRFPVAQDPLQTEIIQLAVRNPTLYPTMVDHRHPGIDFFAPAGTDVISLTSGEVVGIYVPDRTDFDYDTYGSEVESLENKGLVLDPRQLSLDSPIENAEIRKNIASGWLAAGGEGAYIIVRTGNTYFLYAHLDPSSIEVGTHVMEGQTIGSIGKSKEGPAGEHLHLETRIHVTGTVGLDRTTGDYRDSRDKPLIIVNPARYFTADLVNTINQGLALRNRNAQQRGRFEQGNASLDALNQNTQVIDEGADWLYVYNKRRGFEHLERQFDPSATWLHRTDVILSE